MSNRNNEWYPTPATLWRRKPKQPGVPGWVGGLVGMIIFLIAINS